MKRLKELFLLKSTLLVVGIILLLIFSYSFIAKYEEKPIEELAGLILMLGGTCASLLLLIRRTSLWVITFFALFPVGNVFIQSTVDLYKFLFVYRVTSFSDILIVGISILFIVVALWSLGKIRQTLRSTRKL